MDLMPTPDAAIVNATQLRRDSSRDFLALGHKHRSARGGL